MRRLTISVGLVLVAAIGCTVVEEKREPECRSLLGDPLFAPDLAAQTRSKREAQLAEAEVRLAQNPDDVDAMIWVGRRSAYLGRYNDAIAVFDRAIESNPDDPRLYRHRGHRYITLRKFDRAIEDLERAAELIAGTPDRVEPDGLPNARNVPTSTLQSNIWYHLGLAYYLKGDFEQALRCYREALDVSTNPDMLCATSHWLYMTLRRLGRDQEAASVLEPIHEEMEIIENRAYHELLLMYKGERSTDELMSRAADSADPLDLASAGYGVGNWYLYGGDTERAGEVFEQILEAGQWPAFGHIAAEADVARSRSDRDVSRVVPRGSLHARRSPALARSERLERQVVHAEALDVVELLVVLVEMPLLVGDQALEDLLRCRVGILAAGERRLVVVGRAVLFHLPRLEQDLLRLGDLLHRAGRGHFDVALQEQDAFGDELDGQRGRVAVREAGGFAGALGGGLIGAELGLLCGPWVVVCSPVGGIAGAVVGGLLGEEGASWLFDGAE